MKVIDAHAHIFPSKIADKAVASIGQFYDDHPMCHSGSAEELIASGNKAGVVKYLVFSTATTPQQVVSINNFLIETGNTYEEFLTLGTLHNEFSEFEAEIDRLQKAGIKGIKLHPDFQKFNFDDPGMLPVYKELSDREMFVLTHSGDYRYRYSHPARIRNIADKFPKLNIIAAHFGGWSQWKEARECLNLPNVYIDTSSSIPFSGNEVAKLAFETFDNTHIFFGTDFPMWDHQKELETILELGLSDTQLENVLYNNFAQFYGIK